MSLIVKMPPLLIKLSTCSVLWTIVIVIYYALAENELTTTEMKMIASLFAQLHTIGSNRINGKRYQKTSVLL